VILINGEISVLALLFTSWRIFVPTKREKTGPATLSILAVEGVFVEGILYIQRDVLPSSSRQLGRQSPDLANYIIKLQMTRT
jgi:hypothetical protein